MSVIGHSPLAGASGAAGGSADPLYVDDVFSTFLLEGNGSTQTVVNGIDLAGEGGLVWSKGRDASDQNALFDTERGTNKTLISNSQARESTYNNRLTAYNSNGFTVGGSGLTNENNKSYVSWTFRKAPGFFDVVTYSGTGSVQNISHSLGSVPGMIMIHCRDGDHDWEVYHRGIGATKSIHLNQTDAQATDSTVWNNTTPTSSVLTVGTSSNVNQNGHGYVAYVFAHDEQSFGTDSDEAIIKCDSYTGASAFNTPLEVNVGFEPQWVLIKDADSTRGWVLLDTMRGWPAITSESSRWLRPDVNNAESGGTFGYLTSTGFVVNNSSYVNGSSNTFLYMAIRRPHKPPTAGTDVFDVQSRTGSTPNLFNTSLQYVDSAWIKKTNGTGNWIVSNRMTRQDYLGFNNNSAAGQYGSDYMAWDYNYKILPGHTGDGVTESDYLFRRAPGFFDVVAYSGNGSNNHQITHNLGAVPEFALFKERSSTDSWVHFHDMNASTYFFSFLNTGPGAAQSYGSGARMFAQPNTTTLFLSDYATMNQSGEDYICFLFASLDGISKIGTYSGTGSNIDVDCGFTAGARLVLIKRTDSTDDWYLFDSVRGINSGYTDDPYVLLNSNAAQVNNFNPISPLSSGFTVNSAAFAGNLNSNGGTYLFLAIA